MNAPQLPAYLQNRQSQGVAARATTGMGGILPPHISRAGNMFTLIDSAGAKQPVGVTMRACVVDIADVMQKIYYEEDWKQGSDQPPDCYSRNGITPSQDAQYKQSPTCSECQWNVRGSDTSKISGKAIKACRDQKEIALLLPQYPTMLFQMVVPPGSFKNWASFVQPFLKGSVDISDVLVEFGFLAGANGVMTFGAVAYIDEATFAARETAIVQKATDVLVGRLDVPIAITHQPAQVQQPNPLPASGAAAPTGNPSFGHQEQPSATHTQPATQTGFGQGSANTVSPSNTGFGGQPQAQVPFGGAPNAGGAGQQMHQPALNVETKSPSETRAPRKRRTQAEIAADNAAKAAQAGGAPTSQPPAGQPAQAPFPVNQPPSQQAGFGVAPGAPNGGSAAFGGQPSGTQFGVGQAQAATTAQVPAGNGQSFGIQAGADPNIDPALAAMLRELGQP